MRSRTNSGASTRCPGQLPAAAAAKGRPLQTSHSGDEQAMGLDVEVAETHPPAAPAPQTQHLTQVLAKLNVGPSMPTAPACPDGKAVRQCLGGRGVSGGLAAFVVGGILGSLPYMMWGHPEEWAARLCFTAIGAFATGLSVWLIESCAGPRCA